MGVMIVTTIVVAILTLVGTVVWWAMMNSWVEKDRRARGRHVNEPGSARPDTGADDGPTVMKL